MTEALFPSGDPLNIVYAMMVGRTPAPPPAAPPHYTSLDKWRVTLASVLNTAAV
jgi:hypothetical protein